MTDCYVVDDEREAVELISRYIERTPGLSLIGGETDPLIAFHHLTAGKLKPDVVFIDINMPGLLGTDLATQVIATTKVVFTSALSKYAIKAFEIGALDFLEKPFSYQRFLQAINRLHTSGTALAKNEGSSFFIKGNKKGILQRIEINDILFVESAHNYSNIYLSNDKKHLVYLSLLEMELALPKKVFHRVHKSYIVNMNKIEKVEGNKIFILNREDPINCGFQFKESFQKAITEQLLTRKS